MNYSAMRYVASEQCTAKGPARAVLWVVAYHANRDTGECWVGQRTLARESGLARATVQRALNQLFADFILEPVEDHRGPQPERYRIAPQLVEGEAFASGVVESTSAVSGVVEGETVAGEVIHSPSASGLAVSPLGQNDNFLVDSLSIASGLTQRPSDPLVDSLSESSGLLLSPPPAETASKVLSKGFELQGQKQVVGDADASVVADAARPVPESVKQELDRRGLRKPTGPARPRSVDQQPRSREEQLAILKRQIAEDEAKAKNGQEGQGTA